MIAWHLVTELLCITGNKLFSMVADIMSVFACSCKLNCIVTDRVMEMEKVRSYFCTLPHRLDETEGIVRQEVV